MAEEKKTVKEVPTVAFDKAKKYTIEEAVKWARSLAKAKFDESVELHANLGIDPKQGDQQVRGTIALPNGTGKTVKIAAFVQGQAEKDAKEAGADIIGNEELINEIKTKGKIEFDVAITTPDMMSKLSVLAKILGPKGLMPSPKNETITTKIKDTIAQLKKGKIVFKNDDTSNIHVAVGKLSFDDAKLTENITAFTTLLKKSKPSSSKGTFIKNLVLKTSMGPAIKLEA
jgi:large subunit ribosomal protein L1